MNTEKKSPQTLVEAIRYFADNAVALAFMVNLRWPDGVSCPKCGCRRVRFIRTRSVWECSEEHKQQRFSIKTGTVMEDSPLSLDKWLIVIWMEANSKNSISSYEVHRALGITQKSAWFMQQRVRLALQSGNFFKKFTGTVEVDETYIGGLAKNMHKSKRAKAITGTGGSGKAAVMGLLERHDGTVKCSQVRTRVIPNAQRHVLHGVIEANVEKGTEVYTDAWAAYRKMNPDYVHKFVDHAEKYVDGAVHTNGLENFWALMKRCIKGTHVSVEPFHLFRYLDAEAFRFNNRNVKDGDRFLLALDGMNGKRLTYRDLTGKPARGLPPAVEETPEAGQA